MKKVIIVLFIACSASILANASFGMLHNKEIEFLNRYNINYPNSSSGQIIDFTEAAAMSVHAVVHIKTQYQQKNRIYDDFFGSMNPFSDFFGHQPNLNRMEIPPITAFGSGVIVSSDGYIVTNNHVVQEADRIEVTLNDKRVFEAKIVGSDPLSDIAVIKINAINLSYLKYGNSDELKVGEWVLAVGNPFNLTSTVTTGIVSAKARDINILGDPLAIQSFIQTDAAINRGNSGGALVNTSGELVGINAAIASNTFSYTGYSFAIPVNIVKKVVEDIIQYGQVQRAFLGVLLKDIDQKLADERMIKQLNGVYVTSVNENSAAQSVGVIEGDVITKINENEVNSSSELIGYIAQYRPGDKITLTIRRGEVEKSFVVVLKNKEGNTNVIKKSDDVNNHNELGAVVVSISKEDVQKYKIMRGLKVVKLNPDGKLRKAGVEEGFIIMKIDNHNVGTIEDMNKILNNKKGGILIEGFYPNGIKAYYGIGL